MNPVTDLEPIGDLQEIFLADSLNILRNIKATFETRTRRDAAVNHDTSTLDKCALMELTSMLLGTGHKPAASMLDMVQYVFHDGLVAIRATPDPVATMSRLIEMTAPGQRQKLFSLHWTTVDGATPDMDRTQVDELLKMNYASCIEELDRIGARSPEVMLANDDTSEACRSLGANGWQHPVRVGGKAKWESGLSFPARQDITHRLFINSKPLASWLDGDRRPGATPWINELGDAVAIVQSTGGHVANIGMDRAFNKPDVFALASASAIVPGGNVGKPVSVVTPRKFGSDKDTFKWNYLLDTIRGQVFIDSMSASCDKYPGLKALAENAGDVIETKPDGSVAVKYACVALVDEYGAKTPRSLDDLRSEARNVDASFQKTTETLEKTRKEYVAYQEEKNKGKAKKPPSGRGKLREKFKDDTDRDLYHQCIDLQASKKRLETKKTKILSSIVFFAISLFPGENPVTAAATFIEIAREYHARWCIENSFKVVKWSFFRQVRSRRPTRRQLSLVLGMMLHNFWRVFRVKQLVGFMQSKGKPTSLYDETRPWIRKPPDKITVNLIDAVSFLTRIIGIGMVSLIQERIKGGG
jgi:hypothetical protein